MTDYGEQYQYDYDEEVDEVEDENMQVQLDIYKDNILVWARLIFFQASCFMFMDVINVLRGKMVSAIVCGLLHLGYFYAFCKFTPWRAKNTRRTRSGIARAMRILLFVSVLIWLLGLICSITVSNQLNSSNQ